jgi:hypothetical protein
MESWGFCASGFRQKREQKNIVAGLMKDSAWIILNIDTIWGFIL